MESNNANTGVLKDSRPDKQIAFMENEK